MVAYLNTTVIYCEILTLEKVGVVANYSSTFISLAPDSWVWVKQCIYFLLVSALLPTYPDLT